MFVLVESVALLGAPAVLADELVPPAPDSGAEQVTLTYSADPGCPTEAQFVDEIKARVRRPVSFTTSGAATHLKVQLQVGGATAMGTLEVQRPPAAATLREFTAVTCSEVGSALALVTALTLDPNALTEQLPTRRAGSAATSAPQTAPANPTSRAAPPATAPRTAVPPFNAARAAPIRLEGWLGPVAAVVVGEAPQALGLVGLGLGARAITAGAFTPSVQLSPLWGKTGATGPAVGDGDFVWTTGRLEACPLSIGLTRRARLDPCAAVEVGRLTARGAEGAVVVSRSVTRWWVAPGASAAVHWGFEGWFARLGALALLPVTRDQFVFSAPDRAVHQASAVVLGAHLGLGFQLGR